MMLNKNYNNANICILVRSGLDYDDSMIQIKRTTVNSILERLG